jgi:hypothetical protein
MRESFPQSHVFHGDPTLDPTGNTDHYTAPTAIWNKQPTKMAQNDPTSIQKASLSQRLDAIEMTLKQLVNSLKYPNGKIPTKIPVAKRFGEWLAENQ